MSGIVRVHASLQSIKSLPGDFRFMGSPVSNPLQINEKSRSGSGEATTLSIPENRKLRDGIDEDVDSYGGDFDQVNEDSPYGGDLASAEERPSIDEEEVDAVALPLPSSSKPHADNRWGDISSYASKQVCRCLHLMFCCILSFYLESRYENFLNILSFFRMHELMMFSLSNVVFCRKRKK